jgi:AraC-like DNA-binding protein
MPALQDDFAPVRFSTDRLPPRDRIPICREVFGRQMMGVDFEPLPGKPFCVDMTLRRLPALRVGTQNFPALRVIRQPELMTDGEDVFALVMEFVGMSSATAQGREATWKRGQGILLYSMEPCVTLHSNSDQLGVVVPRAALELLVTNVEDRAIRTIPAGNEAMRLLRAYIQTVCEVMPSASPELRHLITTHVYDLVALAVGATHEGAALAESRGLSAARLAAVKADILANLGRRDLSLSFIAKRQKLSERHVRRLFAAEDTSFSDFVLEQRLTRAFRMLGDPRLAERSISAVAYECGFGDLSYFNRCFRRRFGASPRAFRH